MEAKASRGGEPLLPPRTSVDEPATPLIENSARKAPTASADTARSSPRSSDGDDDHKAPNSIALLSDAAPPSSSIASSSFSMFSQSTMPRRGDEGRKEEGVGKGSAASLVPTLRRLHVFSSSPAAAIKRTPSGSIFSFTSQPPTKPERPLPLVPTAALEVAAAPAFAADPPGSAIGTDPPLHRHPSPLSSTALQPSPPAPVAPVECSAPPAAPETLLVHTAAAVDDKVVDAGDAKCITGDSKSEDNDTSASHSLRGDDSAPTNGQAEAPPNAQRLPALLNECLPATSAEPTEPPLHNSADADAKRSEGQSNVASGSFHVPPSASASSLRGPPEEPPGLLCIAPVEQLSNSRHLSRTDDSGSAESEEAATSGDGGDRCGSKHNLQNTSAHSIEVTVERDEPQNGESVSGDSDARESSERCGQPSGSRRRRRTREWDTEDHPAPPMSASRSQLDHEGSPVCGPLPTSAATLDVGLAMVGVAANDVLQQPAAHQHSSSSSSASTRAHSASMKVSTAAPSPMAANTLADSYTMEVSSTQSSVSPAEYSRGSTDPPPSGWPDAVSQVEENKGDDAASTENEALQPSMQALWQQTQEGRACTRGDVPAKATVDAITTEEIPLPLLLPYATHVREAATAATAAGAQPPLHPKEYQEETRAETLASSSALPLLSTPAIAVTREGFSPSGGASTMAAPVLPTGVLPAPTHPSPLGPSSSAPGTSPPLPLSTTHHQRSPPPPSAVAALAPSFAPAKEAAATFEGHDADCAADMSASAASLAPAAVPAALQPLLASSVLSMPSTNAIAADGFTGEAYREECPASLLCIRRPVSVDKVVRGSGSVETAGSLVTPNSFVAQHNRLSLGGTPGNVILGQPPLSMAQFEDRWASSGDDVQHSSDVDDHISRGEGPEGSGSWRSHTSSRPRHGYGSRSRSYSYSYDYSYSTGSVTGSTTQRLCPCATVNTPHLHDEGEGAVTGGTTEASDTEVVRLVEYEEVTPVVRGRNGLLGWLCCGRKKATGGVRTSRMEVHRLSPTAEDTRGAHGIGLSAPNAGSHKHLPKQEGSAATPLATTEAVRADNAIRSEDTAERKDGLDGVKSGGVTGSEGSGPPRGLGSATETPHSSERDISESGDKGLGEAAAYADYRGSTSSYINDDAPPISQASTLVPPHHEAEKIDEDESGGCSHGEEAEAGPAADAAASQQGRTPPCGIADQASFSSTTSAPLAELGVVVSENKEASSADGCTEVDGTNDSRDVGVLESADSVPRGDRLALCAVADPVEPHNHHDSGFGCIGGDEVERREEGAATAASAASHPLLPLSVPTEELLHLHAWDAEPPVAASPSCSHQEWEPDRLGAKYKEEAMTAAEEAQQAICQAVQELMVHPPRQCIFVSVHGLRHWCAALHDPHQAPKAELGSGAAAVLAEEWRCAWDGNLQAGTAIIEDPRWMDVRLAMYAHNGAGERLLAAGTVFSLPSNLEALRRCLGCSGSGGSIDYPATGGYGRDSWSDLLVFQHTESVSKGVVQDMQQAEACDYKSIVCVTEEGKAGHCNGLSGHAPGCRALGCGLASSSSPGSLGGCEVLYVKLEARNERWVSVGDARACAAPTQAGEATSYEAHIHSPVKKAPPDAVSTATTRDGTEGLVAASEQDEEDTHQSSVGRSTEWSSASSCLPLAEAGAPCSSPPNKSNADGGSTRHSIGATPDMGSVHTRAVNESGSDERAHETGTRLEECWRPLAVSPSLLPADLGQLQSDQSPLFTALQTMTEAAATAVTCLGKPLPQLSCRLRWAQEPQPQFTAAPEPAPHAPSVERSLTSWVSLGTAIKEYERVCRGTFTGAASAATVENYHLSRPLTVLWNTIPSHLAAGNHKLQEMQKAGVAPGSLQGWCGKEFAPKVHAMESLTVCSVVMRCTAAILFAHELPNVPGSRYCPPTFLSVTGGCDGVIIEGAAAVGTCDGNSTPITHRAPVMQYNISFHAVLTRDTTSSLLFTVHGAASPADVFGFAVWTPFDDASAVHVQDHHRHGGDADVGGVVDVWLPLFAPASADATPLATAPEEQGNGASSGISFATVSSTRKGQNRSTTGLVLVGWLHCDVEAVFLPSLAEAAVQKLWNGEHRSLSSLAAAVGEESRHECCMGHGIGADEDTLVDFTVMEAAGLRPFVTQFGMPSSPTPLRWDDSSTWGNKSTCTHVYCEVLALQRQRQQGTSHRAPRWLPHAAGVLFPAPSSTVADAAVYMPHSSGHRIGAAVRTDFDAMNLAPESYGQGRVGHCPPLRDSGEAGKGRSSYNTRTWTIVAGAETNTMLPVTDFVAHTNYPRWQHTFRCGLGLLSSLYLRVFDLCHHHLDGDGRMTNPQAAVGSSVRARLSGVPERRAMLLGGTTVSSWLLRRLLCRPSGEGCSWLPLLWSPRAAAQPMTASVMAHDKGDFQQHFFPAVCNGFVLVEWRRASRAAAVPRLPCSRESSSWYASVTRRLPNNSRYTTASSACTRSSLGTFKKLPEFPQRWYCPMLSPGTQPNSVAAVPTADSRKRGWITPEFVPWLRIHKLRLQWPWLQHLLYMRGGQARLSLRYPIAQGETRLLAQCLLVPLCRLAALSTSASCGARSLRVHSRETCDAAGVYGAVLSAASLSDVAVLPNAAAPAEATLCLPVSPSIEVQVWWYPRNSACSAAGGGLDAPPLLIGRGEWRFPAHEEATEMRRLAAGAVQGTFEEALNAQPTTGDAAGPACLGDGEVESKASKEPAPLPTALRSFFAPHEADVRVGPVLSTGMPQHVEGGVLTWRLMSVPRLTCDDWGKVTPVMLPPLPELSSCVSGPCGDIRRLLQPSPAAVPASTWVWPDVGTPAVVHVEVCKIICFDHTDGPCSDAAQATAAVQIAVSGTTCVGSPTVISHDESAAVTEARCWMCPEDAPSPEAPRVAYALSPLYNAAADAGNTWSNTSGHQQQQHQLPTSQASWALKPPLRPPQVTAVAGGGEKSAARSAVPDVGVSRSPTVEVQWPPRRFGWVDSAEPSLSVWVMAPPSLSGGAEEASDTPAPAEAKERVWGAVRLPGLNAFESTSGVLWLPLFQSHLTPALAAEVPRGTAATEDVALSRSSCSDSDTGEHGSATSPSPLPSTEERVHVGVAVTEQPRSTVASGDASDALKGMATPRTEILVKHVGFVAVRYAHNMQRRVTDTVTIGGTGLSAAGPRALLVRIGSLHRRFPVSAAARRPLSPLSSPSFESCTPASEVPLTLPSDAALKHRNAACTTLSTADNAVNTAAATGVLLGNDSGDADVLLGFEGHQLLVQTPDSGTVRDGSPKASRSSGVAVFPLLRRDAADDNLLQLRLQWRLGAAATMATNTMYFDPGGDGAEPESAQWVPLIVRRRRQDVHDADYNGEGESVVAEVLVQWRVVDFSADTTPSGLTSSPMSLQRLVQEYCGGGGASCSYRVLPALSAVGRVHQSPLRKSCADAQRCTSFLEVPGREQQGQGMITAGQVARALSRVLRVIKPRCRPCAYLTLDQLLVQCSVRQRRVWAALQRGTTSSPQEMSMDGGHDDTASARIRFRLEVQLWWPSEWSAAACLPREAAAFATSKAGTVLHNVWIDSGEGVFVESRSPSAPSVSAADETLAYASEERFLFCASMPPLCLMLPSAQVIDRMLGDVGRAARFRLRFALFVVPALLGAKDSPEERTCDVCVGTGRTSMASSPSVQFGITSLLPLASARSGSGPPCAGAKDGVETAPPFLRWRARLVESLPVPPPTSSVLGISPEVGAIAGGSGKMGDDAAQGGEQTLLRSCSSSPINSSAEKDDVIEGEEHTRTTGATTALLLPCTPALVHATVTRMELCGVDVSLARGEAQLHYGALPPATVTVMAADAADKPTDRTGGVATAASTMHQLLPSLVPLRPSTAAPPPLHAISTPSLPLTRLDQPQPGLRPPPQQYTWSTDVCLSSPVSQLIFYVSVPNAVLCSARVEEACLLPRRSFSEADQQEAVSQSMDARLPSWHDDHANVVGKAVYVLNLLPKVEGARRPCDDSRYASAARTSDGRRDVVLEVESLLHGRWLGRLWAQVDITVADLLMRDAASVFFTSRMTLNVERCDGFTIGDAPLTYRAEETYARLRERASLLFERRGRLPRRLRQQLKEVREIRRQLRQGQRQQRDNGLANHAASSREGVLRLTSSWGEQGTDVLPTYTSEPFVLPTATELVRHKCGKATSPSSTRAPLLSFSRDTNASPMANESATTVQLELCQASSGITIAAGQMLVPLRCARTLWRNGAWQSPVSTVTAPLSMRVELPPCTVNGAHIPLIRPVTPSGGRADVTVTWAVHPMRGDTWLRCICLKPTEAFDGAARPPLLLLRWVYCFEATAYPETEHTVDMPLHVRPSWTAHDCGGRSAQMSQAGYRPGNGTPVYWSGAATQLPRIGSVGATIKRVELLEVTPVPRAHLVDGEESGVAQSSRLQPNPPTQDACMTTQLAVHVWTVADELCFEARRHQVQDSGEDALMWLTCGGASSPSSCHHKPDYEVLLGLYTSNSLATYAAQLLAQRELRATSAEKPIAPLKLATQPPRWPPHADMKAPMTCDAAHPIKDDELSSPLPTLHMHSHASMRPPKRGVVPGALGSGGGVVMRALTFRCGGVALATPELGQVDTMTCCVVIEGRRRNRGAALRAHQPPGAKDDSGAVDRRGASVVVLDAGRATSLLQERYSAEGVPQTAMESSPSLASSQLTATWLPKVELSRSTAMASCAAVAPTRADAHHSAQKALLQDVRGALLRVVLPLVQPDPLVASAGDGTGDGDASDASGNGVTTMEEERFFIEVAVRGRRGGSGIDEAVTTAYYVSDPFSASDIFRSARGCGEPSGIGSCADTTEAVAGGAPPLRMSPSQWSSTLTMRLVPAPVSTETTGLAACESSEKEQQPGPLSPLMAPTATMEVTWSLDVLGVLRSSACASGVVMTSAKCARRRTDRTACGRGHCTRAVSGSLVHIADDTDEDDDAGSGMIGMRQLEAYAAWSDFLAAQDDTEKMRVAQAELRHWRCTIVGVEVSDVELLSWCSTGTETDAGTEEGLRDVDQCTSLLAQLVLPMGAPKTATGADAEGQKTQDSDGAGHHRRCRLRNKAGLVMGVARATVTRMNGGGRLDAEAEPPLCNCATATDDACSARSVAPFSSRSRPWCHRYTATFTPLSWSMAVSDMINQNTAAAASAGLTVWQLLARVPASSSLTRSSVDNSQSTAQNTTQLVYNLGATQLAGLLHECALYLVQVLAGWLGDVYTTEEREALLKSASLYPTHWMPLLPATGTMHGTQCDARVRFKCAYSYHGPVLRLPKSISTGVPPCVTAPRALADAVCCAQLHHVQLAYTSLDGAEATAALSGPHRRNGTDAAAAWLSRLTLVMRVSVTTERAVDGTVIHSRNAGQWHTRLAPVSCGGEPRLTEGAWESGAVSSFSPEASSTPPRPMPVGTAPTPVPTPATTLPSVGGAAEAPQHRGDEAHQRIVADATSAPSSVTEVVPLLPTTSFFCWQPPSLEEAMEDGSVAPTSTRVPSVKATETTTTTLVEMVLVLEDEETEEDDSASVNSQGRLPNARDDDVAGTVVGRGQLRFGCSSSKEVVWDVAEGRVDTGWRLYAPLSMQFPVTSKTALPRTECDVLTCAVAPGEREKGEPQSSLLLSLDLLIFTAPSMAQVAALQASQAVQAEQRRRVLSVLRRTEEVLAASAAADHHDDQGSEFSKDACAIATGDPCMTLRQFSKMWISRKPYPLLRAPPIVIRVDTFAVVDAVPSSRARRAAASPASGNRKGGPTRGFQTLWTTLRRRIVRQVSTDSATNDEPCPSERCSGGPDEVAMPVLGHAWLVDEDTGEVRCPMWTLLSNGPPLLRRRGAATCNCSHAPTLASHLHAGRALLRNVQSLRLDWCSEDEGTHPERMSRLASLAGLLGGASVSYTATNGAACVWVSGGLRRRCAQHTCHSTCHASKAQVSEDGGKSARRVAEPVPPLLRSAAHHSSPGRRRRQPLGPPRAAMVAAEPSPTPPSSGLDSCTVSCPFDYVLYASHFLSCAVPAQDGQTTTPEWRCAVHVPTTDCFPAASLSTNATSRLFHSATLVGGRIWLVGGWVAAAGVTTLPSTLEEFVGTARLVERRRREVRQAVTHSSDNGATSDCLSPAPLAERVFHCATTSAPNAQCRTGNPPASVSLRWCEVVQSVQCLNDGFPAPPVDAPPPSLQVENSLDASAKTGRRLAAPPRLACHVAVTCEDRYVAVFGGLMAPTGTDDNVPGATSAVHIYDTVQGTWFVQYEPNMGNVQDEWPVARYGHCVTPVPGTGGARQPCSYFVFGGATTTSSCRTLLVPPTQLLWIWTPVQGAHHYGRTDAVEGVLVHSTWRRVQLPVEFTTPLAGRFLSQLHAYSAVEVAAAVCGTAEPLDNEAAVPSDPGLTSMILCVAGGMTTPALPKLTASTYAHTPYPTKASTLTAYGAFCEYVEPWFAHPASDVASILLECVCEREQQLPSLSAYTAASSQARTCTH